MGRPAASLTSGAPRLRSWREGLTSVEYLGAYRPMDRNLITDDGRAEPVNGVEISASAFRVIPTPPYWAGPRRRRRASGAPPVVVLGERLWQARFGADPAIVGRDVRLGDVSHTVVGVMPERSGSR